eukprot:scaffold5099_cov50-Attheya_sp.AAC.1
MMKHENKSLVEEDDGLELANQVVQEGERDRGVRSEWEEHVGWHRKENIHLRGRHQWEDIETDKPPPPQSSYFSTMTIFWGAGGFLSFLVVMWIRIRRRTNGDYKVN